MTREQAIERISEIIKNSDNDDLMDISNGYQEEVNGVDYIYRMEDFDELMSSYTPSDLTRRMFYGDFNPNHDFFWYNGYGNLCSGDYLDECNLICKNEIAEWCVDFDNDFNSWRIREVLDEYNENEEEEE